MNLKRFPRLVTRCLGVSLIAALLAAVPAAHAITADEAKCRTKLATSLAKYVKAAQKAVNSCHKARDKGDLPAMTNCNDLVVADTNTGSKASAAKAKAGTDITTACSAVPSVLTQFVRCPAPFQASDDAGTSGIDSLSELTTCLFLHIDDQLTSAYTEAMGSPTITTTDQGKCHAAIGKNLAKVIDTTVKERSNCQKKLDKTAPTLGFSCATYDAKLKISKAIDKGVSSIATLCASPAVAAAMDSCAATGAELADCAVEEGAGVTAAATASLLWELPGNCPGGAKLRFEESLGETDYDFGWRSYNSEHDPASGFPVARYALSGCDSECENCSTSGVTSPPEACRCNGDGSVLCSVDGDCAGFGGTCQCHMGPPMHLSAGGLALCVRPVLASALTGSADPTTGDVSLSGTVRFLIHSGLSILRPCPTCAGGTCHGGARDGLACSVDGSDATFGDVSYDCPPNPASNISGTGLRIPVSFTTGSVSLPAAVPCDAPLNFLDCACSTCSLDNTIPCNSDAECSGVGAGVCRTDGGHGGPFRKPNECSDLACSPDPSLEPNEGKCLADPDTLSCDGFLREDGRGVISCDDNSDCAAYSPLCNGGGCGTCSVAHTPDCFLDPIAASGAAGDKVVTAGCMVPTSVPATNTVFGLPGPFRIQQPISFGDYTCADLVTPFIAPGGSNCP